jgi:23S rRNA (cytidine1920-2'-O)/16S rRNA (cytidine1409-2'-O)-methyltransferase
MSKKIRADELLVHSGLVESRAKAQACIMAGQVRHKGEKIQKSSQLLPSDETLTLDTPLRYVGRGGLKMENFIKDSKWMVKGLDILDLGASTGGFTDCLLQMGANSSTCVDVGRGQLHYKLRTDKRVTNLEKTNLRSLQAQDLPKHSYPLIVMDLSFISLRKVLKEAWQFLQKNGRMVALIKPQFECIKKEADLGRGIIKDNRIHLRVLDEIKCYADQNLNGSNLLIQTTAEPKGNDGNTEFFLGWERLPSPTAEIK